MKQRLSFVLMTGEFKRLNLLRLSSLREGFFSRRSNLKAIATSESFKIPACAGMTIILLKSAASRGIIISQKSYISHENFGAF